MFKKTFSTATWKQSQITIVGTIINGTLGAIFYIMIARFLGPYNFGLITISIATLALLADIVDFGTNTGIVKFVSANIVSNKDKAMKFLKLSLEIKFLVWFVVLALGISLSPLIASQIFNKEELTEPLKLVMLGVGGVLLFSFATSTLQAFQRYFTWSLVNILTNLLRLVCIFILILNQKLNLNSVFLTYLILPFFGFSLTLFFIPIKSILKIKNEFSVKNEFFGFNFWVALFAIIAAISTRLDTFITARLLSPNDVGLYGAANQLVQVVPQIIGALGIVIAPKFSSFVNIKQMISYLKKTQILVLGIALIGLLVIPISYYLIPLFFGVKYAGTVAPFVILFFAMLVFLISLPIHISIIYYFAKPQIFVWINIGHLILIGTLGYIFISRFGVIGASLTVLSGMVFNLLLPLIWFIIKIKKGDES